MEAGGISGLSEASGSVAGTTKQTSQPVLTPVLHGFSVQKVQLCFDAMYVFPLSTMSPFYSETRLASLPLRMQLEGGKFGFQSGAFRLGSVLQ